MSSNIVPYFKLFSIALIKCILWFVLPTPCIWWGHWV